MGMQRRGFSDEDVRFLKTAFKKLFLKKTLNLAEHISVFKEHDDSKNQYAQRLIEFIESSERGVTR